MFYIYRATTDKLGDALNRITANGDTVRDVVHVGGRDWVIICRQGVEPEPQWIESRTLGGEVTRIRKTPA